MTTFSASPPASSRPRPAAAPSPSRCSKHPGNQTNRSRANTPRCCASSTSSSDAFASPPTAIRSARLNPTGRSKQVAEFPAPAEGILLTHFIVSRDVERSRRFYTEVLGGEAVLEGEPTIIAIANGWITINLGGGPTDDKPAVTLEPPPDPDRVSSFLNIRVADIAARYEEWSARGAEFLTPA